MTYSIHWFRRDLRIAGNNALRASFQKYNGRVIGIFCFDKKFLSRKDFSVNRFQFFLKTLESLKEELRAAGGDLLVLDVGPDDAFEKVFKLLKNNMPDSISFCRDYEPFALKRDKRMTKYFESYGVEVQTFRDHLVIEPWELSKPSSKDDEGYKVFTPFARRWNELFDDDVVYQRIKASESSFKYIKELQKGKVNKVFDLTWKDLLGSKLPKDYLVKYLLSNGKLTTVDIPPAGTLSAYKALKEFSNKIDKYGDLRDIPSIEGTSKFSMYLKNGSLTTSQVIAYYNLKSYFKPKDNRDKFLSELIWREFYYHILYRFSYVEKGCFKSQYDEIKWNNNKKHFNAWKEGKTGFPIVDAGMRELKETGWMHNRVRMIVASFLIKDLLIDWKWGEKYFMETLLDGDLAPNNGGWQWAASTGCDAQPYFRIFNPWSQSKKFDPDGEYIKKYVPELMDVPAKKLHAPILDHSDYPEPIIDHATQRMKALKIFEAFKK